MFKFVAQMLPRLVFGMVVLINCPKVGARELVGPNTTTVGVPVKIEINGYDVLIDPKLICTPENTHWEAVRRLDGQPIITFTPDKVGVYTFVLAGCKPHKDPSTTMVASVTTLLETHTVVVTNKAEVTPIGGTPPALYIKPAAVDPGKYTKQLSVYVPEGSDAVSLKKLIAIYQALAGQVYTVKSTGQFYTVTATAVGNVAGYAELKEAIATILKKELGTAGYDPDATKVILTDIGLSLKPFLP